MATEIVKSLCKDALPATECKRWDVLKTWYMSPERVLIVRIPGASQDQEACTLCFKENQGQDRLIPKSECKKHKFAHIMDSHFKEKKTNSKIHNPCKCTTCGKGFSDSAHLKRHLRSHTGEKPFGCGTCDKRFAQAAHLKRHTRTHTGERPFSCDICGKAFAASGSIDLHTRIHAGEKRYFCKTCGKAFAQSITLTRHNIVHTGEKPHSCKQCGQVFSHKSSLKRHEDLHERSKHWTFVCPMQDCGTDVFVASGEGLACGAKFPRGDALDRHIQWNHTPEGMAARKKTEDKMEKFLTKNDILFSRDRNNFISFVDCKDLKTLGKRVFPDFELIGLSAKLGARIFLENDESEHRRYPCDMRRLLAIRQALFEGGENLKMIVIRFNPHFFMVGDTLYDPSLPERFKRLLNVLQNLKVVQNGPDVQLYYLFYSQTEDADQADEEWQKLDVFVNIKKDDVNHQNVNRLRPCVMQAII